MIGSRWDWDLECWDLELLPILKLALTLTLTFFFVHWRIECVMVEDVQGGHYGHVPTDSQQLEALYTEIRI